MRVGIQHVEEKFVSNYSFFLIISWSVVYLAHGIISVVVWWWIQAFSVVSIFVLIGSIVMFAWKASLESE